MLDTYMRIAPTHILLDRILSQATWAARAPMHILLDRILSQATWAALRSDAAIKARCHPPRDSASRHPCWQAASFLPCASRPPDACRVHLARPRQRLGHGSRERRAAAHGLRAKCIRRTESSGGLLATSFGGLQHFQGPHILSGRSSSPA
jgi:hypothetical protein